MGGSSRGAAAGGPEELTDEVTDASAAPAAPKKTKGVRRVAKPTESATPTSTQTINLSSPDAGNTDQEKNKQPPANSKPGQKKAAPDDKTETTATPISPKTSTKFSIQKLFTKPQTFDSPTPRDEQCPPHINLFDEHVANIKDRLQKLIKGDKLVFNQLGQCTQVRTNDFETFELIKADLEKHHDRFYHYPLNGPQLSKFVLYQLINVEVGDIIEDLQQYGLEPVEVQTMKINKPRYEGHTNYLVSFDRNDHVTMSTLQKVRYIQHSVVKWRHYRQAPEHVLQCRNCFRFGHGTSGCFMECRCMICAKNHKTDNCPLIAKKRRLGLAEIPDIYLKCCNCGGNHTAAYAHCSSRINFIAKRKKNKDPEKQQQQQVNFVPATAPHTNVWNESDFPDIRPRRAPRAATIEARKPLVRSQSLSPRRVTIHQQIHQQHYAKRASPNKIIRKKNNTPRAHRPTKQPQQTPRIPVYNNPHYQRLQFKNKPISKNSITEQINNRNEIKTSSHLEKTPINPNCLFTCSTDGDLFTADEAMDIFRDMLRGIRSCRSKEDQLNTLMKIAFKYQ